MFFFFLFLFLVRSQTQNDVNKGARCIGSVGVVSSPAEPHRHGRVQPSRAEARWTESSAVCDCALGAFSPRSQQKDFLTTSGQLAR